MDIKKEIYATAELLNIKITEEEAEGLENSFILLINSFSIMQNAKCFAKSEIKSSKTNNNIADNSLLTPHINLEIGHIGTGIGIDSGMGRDDVCHTFCDTGLLVERSEEHEDNFVRIPNVL